MSKKAMEEVLKVTQDGEFIWHPDADRLIEEGDYSDSPAMQHILRALRAKQEPVEPVGWIDSKGNMICTKINESCKPLYTTPPQRKPLTDDELLRLLSRIDECAVRLPKGLREFARAIEAAHGIKENT